MVTLVKGDEGGTTAGTRGLRQKPLLARRQGKNERFACEKEMKEIDDWKSKWVLISNEPAHHSLNSTVAELYKNENNKEIDT